MTNEKKIIDAQEQSFAMLDEIQDDNTKHLLKRYFQMQQYITRGGFVKDRNGNLCKEGDIVKYFQSKTEFLVGKLVYLDAVRCMFFVELKKANEKDFNLGGESVWGIADGNFELFAPMNKQDDISDNMCEIMTYFYKRKLRTFKEEFTLKALAHKIPVTTIMELTGFSREKIKKISGLKKKTFSEKSSIEFCNAGSNKDETNDMRQIIEKFYIREIKKSREIIAAKLFKKKYPEELIQELTGFSDKEMAFLYFPPHEIPHWYF